MLVLFRICQAACKSFKSPIHPPPPPSRRHPCPFSDVEEFVEHIFLSLPFTKIVWRIVFSTYNIPLPTNIKNMFENWLNDIDKKSKARI
jgi:hypothetical protein